MRWGAATGRAVRSGRSPITLHPHPSPFTHWAVCELTGLLGMGILLPMVGSQEVLPGAPPPLFGKTRQTLLALLFSRADEAHLQENLIQAAALGRGSVQRELEFLARAGIVQRNVRGR
jgi:hypothetical protein